MAFQSAINLKRVNSNQDGVIDFTGLPNLERIGYQSFESCKNITTIKIGASVNFLAHGFIEFATNITGLYIYRNEPPTLEVKNGWYTFENLKQLKIYVPKGCGQIYKQAENWSEYADIILEME